MLVPVLVKVVGAAGIADVTVKLEVAPYTTPHFAAFTETAPATFITNTAELLP